MQQPSFFTIVDAWPFSTVSLFLKTIRGYISEDALLVMLYPTDISGKKVVKGKDFFEFKPSQSL